MSKIWIAAAACLALASCGKKDASPVAQQPNGPAAATTTTTPPAAPALPEALKYAAHFDCEGGVGLEVAFNQSEGAVLLRAGTAAPVTLKPKASDSMAVWTDGTTSLSMQGGGEFGYSAAVGAAPKPCKFVARDLPPPQPAGVAKVLTAADAGTTLALKVHDKFAVSFRGVPTAGYVWGAEAIPPFVKDAGSTGGATSTAQFLPGFAGGNHWEVLIFEVTAAGQSEMSFAQRRPWEKDTPPSDTFKFTLKAE